MVTSEARAWPRERVLPLEGGRNFRDLGGYPTEDGRHVKWGALFRSGTLSRLTQADWDHLCARGVRTLCDFRTSSERDAEPFAWADAEGISYWARDYKASFADLRETLKSGFATHEAARQGMISGYRDLPFQQAPAYRQLFAHLKAGDVPLVFNCAAGKDRTGTAAALILTALRVPREVVMADFALTNEVYDVERLLTSGRSSVSGQPEGVARAIARADPAYVEAALESIDARHGGIDPYLRDVLDVSAGDLEAIRDNLLE